MKALQKNQGRTDQMLGAMADILTSLAIPNQQWLTEGGEGEAPVREEGPWVPVGLDWDQDPGEDSDRRERTDSPTPTLWFSSTDPLVPSGES
ncbi:hypothetical protein NHX12_012991 [Muraenolepis orangiensis]|uniref:Uncharacterized protein n=1 Tax=Muraenolepis orangiensis TaxID=630683 RepID=A0A9Q0DGJ8_9TELE|nr:hypothetical protein NHX12_012991 [Muraenolepis orangiensis]